MQPRETEAATLSTSATARRSQLARIDSLIPPLDHPFFIVSPPYTRISAGITVLHLLCHFLNRQGRPAWMVHHPLETTAPGLLPHFARLQQTGEVPTGLIAPLITQEVIDVYDAHRLTPVVIYPEVYDNPFAAPFLARYILNYPGLLAPKPDRAADYSFAFSRTLAEASGAQSVLHMVTSDLGYWTPDRPAGERSGVCHYAGKLSAVFGEQPKGVPEGSVAILQRTQMPRARVRDLFRRSTAFYCYEDTALAIEARLCGCPVVFVPTERFSGTPLSAHEQGSDGACVLGEPGGLERATATVGAFEARVRATLAGVPEQVDAIASALLAMVRARPYQGTITLPLQPRLVLFEPLALEPVGFQTGEPAEPPAEVTRPLRRFEDADGADLDLMGESRLRAEIAALRSSTSWRITAPLRRLVTLLRRR